MLLVGVGAVARMPLSVSTGVSKTFGSFWRMIRPIEDAKRALLPSPWVAMLLDVCNVSFLSITDYILLRIEFRTKGPWPFEAVGLRVIGARADGYIVASLMLSHCSASQVDGRMRSRRTIDVGARGKRHQANHWNYHN
jgi:hypothetical protein